MTHPFKSFIKCGTALGALAGAIVFTNKLKDPSFKASIVGNLPVYSPALIRLDPSSPLYGKRIGFLGSSITKGEASHDVSFVEYLAARDGVVPTKSAISGTTLAGGKPDTYVSRLATDFNDDDHYDLFVCQLSTNDSRVNIPLGKVTAETKRSGFDTNTTLGAIEHICANVKKRFNCPVVFYTCVRGDDEDYALLVEQLYELQKKWGFAIIDLWANPVVKTLNAETPAAMRDDAHPTQLGYEKIWTPIFEKQLAESLE